MLSFLLLVGIPSELLPSCFPTKNPYVFLFCLISSTYLAHLILLDVIIQANFIW